MFSRRPRPALTDLPAADLADAEVQFKLGLKFAGGLGAAPDYVQAAEWYRKAAAQSHPLAQYNLGMMYARGQGVTPNAVEAGRWLGKAAQLGDAGAQYHFGERCHRASYDQLPAAAAESRIEAYKWYRLAAAQGCQNSERAYATLTINMSRADVTDGLERVAAFAPGKPKLPPG